MSSENTKIKYLTGLRGICALWVMMGHIFYSPSEVHKSHGVRFLIELLLSLSYIGVDVFFILSSYVLSINYDTFFKKKVSKSNYKIYLQKRIARIYPLYFFVVLIAVIFEWKSVVITDIIPYFTFTQIFKNPNINGLWVTWSLCIEMIIYIILPFVFRYNIPNIAYILFSIIGYCIVAMSGDNTFKFFLLNKTEGIIAVLRGLSGYSIGIVLFRYYQKTEVRYRFIDFIVQFLSLSSIYFMGLISYSIYLIHPLVLSFFPSMFHMSRSGKSEAIVYITSTLLISSITYFLIELPGKRLFYFFKK